MLLEVLKDSKALVIDPGEAKVTWHVPESKSVGFGGAMKDETGICLSALELSTPPLISKCCRLLSPELLRSKA